MDNTQDNLTAQETTGQAQPDAGLTFTRFGQIMTEIRDQPLWRSEADKCADYYDGNQLDADTVRLLEQRGMGPLIVNLIKPTIDMVLGMEAKTRTDWRVQADNDEFQDVAEALSAKLHEAERETRADRACSDGYASMIKAGLGWVEVSKQSDPFAYPIRACAVHRREIFYDWVARDPGLTDSRYKVRKRWFDLDQAEMYFPKHKGVLHGATMGWAIDQLQAEMVDTGLMHSFDSQRSVSFEDYEWRNAERLLFAEVWYRQHARGYVLTVPDGRTVELDMRNPAHLAAITAGGIKPKAAVYQKMRMSVWAGPIRLLDRPVKRNVDPYIPFFGYREDLTGVPYGLIRTMLSPQDEVNARRQKLMWLLSARRVTMDSDSLDKKANTISEMLAELARADAVVQLNPSRRNQQGFQVDANLEVGKQQYEIMKDAEDTVQRAAGIYQPMLGSAEQGTTSGIAINSLVEQGTTTLAEINDNYRYSRRAVGEAIVNLICDNIGGQQVNVVVGEDARKRIISLNMPARDPQTGMVVLQNDVQRSQIKVALEDVPSTPSYRAQQAQMLTQVMQSLAPEVQAVLLPHFFDSTELPQRKQIVATLKQVLNLPDTEYKPGQDPEKDKLMQTVQQLHQQLQQMAQSPEFAKAQADALDTAAAAEQKKAQAEKIRAEVARMGLEDERQRTAPAASPAEGELRAQVEDLTAEYDGAIQEAAKAGAELQSLRTALERAQIEENYKREMVSTELRKAEIEAETRKAEAEAEVRKAEIEAEARKKEAATSQREDSLKPLASQIEQIKQAIADLVEAREKTELAEVAPTPNITIPVNITVEKSGAKTATIKKQDDGSYSAVVEDSRTGE